MIIQINAPKQKGVVGIDFGTTNSILCLYKDEKFTFYPEQPIPSIIRFNQQGLIDENGDIEIRSIKRLMGKQCHDSGSVYGYNRVEIASEIFKKLMKESGGVYENAIVTVPAYFDDAAKREIKDAAQMAGWKVVRMMSEPTAAAISYGIEHNAAGLYLVYDLGGGTFDISLLKLEDSIFKVIANDGDHELGGDDIDRAIAEFLSNKYNISVSDELIRQSRTMKENLCTDLTASGFYTLTLDELKALSHPIIQKTINITQDILRTADRNIDAIILVGGATRMPYLRALLAQNFEHKLIYSDDPERIVAAGAAVYATNLYKSNKYLLLDATSLSLGVEIIGGVVDRIIERNTPIPTKAVASFTTYADAQTHIDLNIVQGEREFAKDCRSIARMKIPVRPAVAGSLKFLVEFLIDENNLLTVEAYENSGNEKNRITIDVTKNLSEDIVKTMLFDSIEHAYADAENRLLIDAINVANNNIKMISDVHIKYYNLISTDAIDKLGALQKAITECIESNEIARIRSVNVEADNILAPIMEKIANSRLAEFIKEVDIERLTN